MSPLRHQPLARQLAFAVFVVCLVAFSALVAVMSWLADRAALRQVETHLTQQMSAIAASIEDNFRAAEDAARLRMDIYKRMLGAPPVLSRETAPAGNLPAVPVLRAGAQPLNGNMELLTRIRDLLNAEPAVMVRHEGKFIRVATFLKDKDGKSMIGVPLPADGKETRSLTEGKAYFGLISRNGTYFMSIYDPVFDENKQVVGAISIRVGIGEIISQLRETVGKIKVGDQGYAYVIAPGASLAEARLIAHPVYAGHTVGEAANQLLERAAEMVLKLRNGVLYYDWTDPRDQHTGTKIAVAREVGDGGWIVAAGSWVDEFTAEGRQLRNLMIAVVLLCAVAIVGAVIGVATRSLRPVREMVERVERMGNGDLRQALEATRADTRCETDVLGRSLARMQQGMGTIVRQIGDASREMATATQTLSEASAAVTRGSAVQSESAAALAAAVQELSVSVGHVSANAADAEGLASEAAAAARAGNGRVSEVVGSMNQIEAEIRETAAAVEALGERTAQIGSVISIIKDVADQTNLLALNAAIEAARAGEQGRGFAVVADEVRKLAERTTVSTAEISRTIGSVQEESRAVAERIGRMAVRAESGVQAAGGAGAVLNEIERQSQAAVGAVSDIAGSTREQSAASQEIARGVEKISRMAEANREASQANLDGVQRIRALADELSRSVSRFQV